MRRIRSVVLSLLAVAGCANPAPPRPPALAATPSTGTASVPTRFRADTPRRTARGATFTAPGGWSILVRGPAIVLEAPEGDSRIALVDVSAESADAAVASAWAAFQPGHGRPVRS